VAQVVLAVGGCSNLVPAEVDAAPRARFADCREQIHRLSRSLRMSNGMSFEDSESATEVGRRIGYQSYVWAKMKEGELVRHAFSASYPMT